MHGCGDGLPPPPAGYLDQPGAANPAGEPAGPHRPDPTDRTVLGCRHRGMDCLPVAGQPDGLVGAVRVVIGGDPSDLPGVVNAQLPRGDGVVHPSHRRGLVVLGFSVEPAAADRVDPPGRREDLLLEDPVEVAGVLTEPVLELLDRGVPGGHVRPRYPWPCSWAGGWRAAHPVRRWRPRPRGRR